MNALKKALVFSSFGFCFTISSKAATVKKVNAKKKIVMIDAGENEGFKKGSSVCFYQKPSKKNKKEKEDKEITCGQVSKSQSTKAIIKVTKKITKIKKGFRAALADKDKDKASKSPSAPYSWAIRGLYLPYFVAMTPASYNLITYQGASSTEGESLWLSDTAYADGSDSMILASFGGEVELKSLSLRLGLHYKAYRTYSAETDYDIANTNLYLFSQLDASAMGFYLDYAFELFSDISIGAGIDFDMTSLTFVATRMDDLGAAEEIALYDIQGSTNILSLRIPIRYDPYFDPIGISLGVNLMLPLTDLGTSVSATVDDATNSSKVEDPEADVIAALALGKGSFAIETVLGAYFAF